MRKGLIRKLHEMQKWRRGKLKVMPLTPTEWGVAIDDCIRVLRGVKDEDVERMLKV